VAAFGSLAISASDPSPATVLTFVGDAETVTPARCNASMKAVRANVAGSVRCQTFSVGGLSAAMVPVVVMTPFGVDVTAIFVAPPAGTVVTKGASLFPRIEEPAEQ